MSFYLDTSVLVSCYVPEVQSSTMLKLLEDNATEELMISQLTEVEFHSALAMKQRLGELEKDKTKDISILFQKHLTNGYYTKISLNEEVYQLAKNFILIPKITLRALDALHLALAQYFGLKLITADQQLAKASKYFKIKSKLVTEIVKPFKE